MKNTKAESACRRFREIFAIYGCPQRIITGRGTAFTSKNFKDMCQKYLVANIKNATGTPRTNGQVERFNHTITNAITTSYQRDDGRDWDKRLSQIQFALNGMRSRTTQKTPHELVFSYTPRTLISHKLIKEVENEENEVIGTEKCNGEHENTARKREKEVRHQA